jgi:hypothetical protein
MLAIWVFLAYGASVAFALLLVYLFHSRWYWHALSVLAAFVVGLTPPMAGFDGATRDLLYGSVFREAIMDSFFNQPTQQRRLSNQALANSFQYAIGFNSEGQVVYQNECYQPFVLHTTDEIAYATIPGTQTEQPSHAVALRTVDFTASYDSSQGYPACYPRPYGGGKLGYYSFWDLCNPQQQTGTLNLSAPILPDPTPPGLSPMAYQQIYQYEFYNYAPGQSLPTPTDPGETENYAFQPGVSYSYAPPNAALGYEYFAYFNDTSYGVPTPCAGAFAPTISISPVTVKYELYNGGYNIAPGVTNGQSMPSQITPAIALAYQYYVCYLQGQIAAGKISSGALQCAQGESLPMGYCPAGS